MLDIVLFREDQGGDPGKVRESQRRRYKDVGAVDAVIERDTKWRAGMGQGLCGARAVWGSGCVGQGLYRTGGVWGWGSKGPYPDLIPSSIAGDEGTGSDSVIYILISFVYS